MIIFYFDKEHKLQVSWMKVHQTRTEYANGKLKIIRKEIYTARSVLSRRVKLPRDYNEIDCRLEREYVTL